MQLVHPYRTSFAKECASFCISLSGSSLDVQLIEGTGKSLFQVRVVTVCRFIIVPCLFWEDMADDGVAVCEQVTCTGPDVGSTCR
jgi:hypothetical protein